MNRASLKNVILFGTVLLGRNVLLSWQPAQSATPLDVPLTAAHWRPVDIQVNSPLKARLQFLHQEAFPNGLLRLDSGSALLSDVSFATGTVEFDIKPLPGDGLPGIRFHQRDGGTAEDFYLRPSTDCPASQDCLQYAPVTHGRMLWDLFVQDQKPAPIRPTEWNHVRMVVSRHRMEAFINGLASPSLTVDSLEGDASRGGIELEGPAVFANLIIKPGVTDGLPSKPVPDPIDRDPRFLRNWRVSTPATLPADTPPSVATMPGLAAGCTKLTAEVWVFVNGQAVFADENLYNNVSARKTPDGRLSLQNGEFELPLHAGRNDLAIALSSNFPAGSGLYGWGLEMRLDDLHGVLIPSSRSP